MQSTWQSTCHCKTMKKSQVFFFSIRDSNLLYVVILKVILNKWGVIWPRLGSSPISPLGPAHPQSCQRHILLRLESRSSLLSKILISGINVIRADANPIERPRSVSLVDSYLFSAYKSINDCLSVFEKTPLHNLSRSREGTQLGYCPRHCLSGNLAQF